MRQQLCDYIIYAVCTVESNFIFLVKLFHANNLGFILILSLISVRQTGIDKPRNGKEEDLC